MAQIFSQQASQIVYLVLYGLLALVLVVPIAWVTVDRAPWVTGQYVALDQPVPFSHAHHVGEVGLDCRYCHSTVETSAYAGMPPISTCMTCHSQLFTDQPMLRPLVRSWQTHVPLQWNRVNQLPDFVYFNHSIHVRQGVGCETCHGRVDRMPLMVQKSSLQMEWCLDCHRDPAPNLRPRDQITLMGYVPGAAPPPPTLTADGSRVYHVGGDTITIGSVEHMTSCSVCHR